MLPPFWCLSHTLPALSTILAAGNSMRLIRGESFKETECKWISLCQSHLTEMHKSSELEEQYAAFCAEASLEMKP